MTCWEVFDTPSYHPTCPTSFGWSLDTSPCQVSEILHHSKVYRATTKFHSPHTVTILKYFEYVHFASSPWQTQ